MSGTNPFRRRDPEKGTSSTPDIESRASQSKINAYVPPIDTDPVRSTKTKTSKTVRIISPQPLSSDTEESEESANWTSSHRASPPPSPSSPIDRDDQQRDAFPTHPHGDYVDLHDDEIRQNAAANIAQPTHYTTQPPSNPFKSSLLPKGAADAVKQEETAHREDKSRQQYDVDAFTQLLLTGARSKPETSGTAPQVAFGDFSSQRAKSKAHDATSVTEQPKSTADSGSPASHATWANSATVDKGYEHGNQAIEEKTQRQKPSTPAHRHGKVVNQNAPLTVSFADPSLSSSEGTSASGETAESKLTDSHDETSSPMTSTPSTTHDDLEARANSATPKPRVSSDNQTFPKKVAPAPPPSRRQGLARTKSSGTDSNMSTTIKEDGDNADESVTPSPVPTQHKPKPPPPRRGASVRHDSSSSAVTMSSIRASPESLPQSPPVTGSSRRPVSGISQTSQNPAPPVPPPRRRGSSQSSYTPSRLSGDYRSMMTQRSRGDSGASSISQLQIPPVESAAAPQQPRSSSAEVKDPMADLSALQRELDEYRKNVGR